ncbi:MAG: carboxylesterase [Halieaceae bacterium]|nr:carboxylesterase [Halieaceae bacterium]
MYTFFRRVAVGFLFLFLVACKLPEQFIGPSLAVETTSGHVVGDSGPEGSMVYRDVAYAQPPIAERRWAPPSPLKTPDRRITTFSEPVMCPQPQSMASGDVVGEYLGSEDCLYLDIYTPGPSNSADPLPVMLWIHGGSNLTGHKGTYDFSRLAARQQVVVVVINYRLGPLGWFVHPALNGTDPDEKPVANFGTLDIIEALRWTQQNIRGFRGDPNNVTVFGESAGGRNVFSLLASPLAGGLFHRAIAQSGHVRSVGMDEAYNFERQYPMVDRGSWEVVAALGLDSANTSAANLRDVPAHELLRAYFGLEEDHIQPLVIRDGVVIPREGILTALANPRYAKGVPVMAGTTRDEITLWLGLSHYFVDVTYPLTRFLPAKLRIKDADQYAFWVDMRSRGWKLGAVDEPFAAMSQAGYDELYAYRYDWDEQADNYFVPFSKILGASHASEIAFVMGAPMYGEIGDYMYPDTDSARKMTEIMMSAWGSFAYTGNPQIAGGPTWPRYNSTSPAFMRLDVGDALAMSDDVTNRNELLERVADSLVLTALEQCLLVWELVTAVGMPDYSAYVAWKKGQCAEIDAAGEKRRIREALEAEHGSVYFSG